MITNDAGLKWIMQPTLMHFLMDVEASSHYNNSKLQHALNHKTYPAVQ